MTSLSSSGEVSVLKWPLKIRYYYTRLKAKRAESAETHHYCCDNYNYCCCYYYYYTRYPFNGLFSETTWVSRYQKGKTSLDLYEATDDGVLRCSGISWKQTICTSLQTEKPINTSSLNFYSTDALADTQLTVSKH